MLQFFQSKSLPGQTLVKTEWLMEATFWSRKSARADFSSRLVLVRVLKFLQYVKFAGLES